jgi:hypothetical protein
MAVKGETVYPQAITPNVPDSNRSVWNTEEIWLYRPIRYNLLVT